MKKLFLFLGLIICFSGSYSQDCSGRDISLFLHQKEVVAQEAASIFSQMTDPKNEYVLDSVIFYQMLSETDSVYSSKEEYLYPEEGKRVRITSSWEVPAGIWHPQLQYTWIFDANGNLTEYTRQSWDDGQPGWVNVSQYQLTYNAAGQEILFLYRLWDESAGEWANYIKEDYVYNASGNMTSLWSWTWDDGTGGWKGEYRQELEYSLTELLLVEIFYMWEEDIGDWWDWSRQEYSYDISGFLVLMDGHSHDPGTGLWHHTAKMEYANNPAGQPDTIVQYHSNDNGISWDPGSKDILAYDDAGNHILTTGYTWNAMASEWENNHKTEIGWDTFGNRVLDKWSIWDEMIQGWQLMNMTEREYTASGELLMYANYYYNSEAGGVIGELKYTYTRHPAGHALVRFDYIWNAGLPGWELDEKGYYYHTVIMEVPVAEALAPEVYPNPAASVLFIHIPEEGEVTFEIFSGNGRLVSKGTGNGQGFGVDVRDLPDGLYLIRIHAAGKQAGRLFIKN